MLRKLPADDSIAETAAEKPPKRAIKATMDSRRPRLVCEETLPCSDSLQDDFSKITEWFGDAPCTVLVRLQDHGTLPAKEDDWLVIVWTPPSVPGPQKVLWGTSTDSITEAMPSQCRIKGLDATTADDVTWEKFFAAAEGVTGKQRPIFFDMKHSNNGARIRLWIALKEGMSEKIESRLLTYDQLKEPEFTRINPLQKIPGYRRTDGVTIFESDVILRFLEDKYGGEHGPSFQPATPEDRQVMNLMMRIHDLYIASPNITAPGFSHSQGAMYLSTEWHGKARGMDLVTRAAKIAEIWKQLSWLNRNIVGPYLVGDKVSLADFTWFPTTIFMEFMLPRVFQWPDIFRKTDGPFPNIAKWWTKISEEPAFKDVRQQIWEYWEEMELKGQFKPIITEIAADKSGLKFQYP